MAEFGSIVPCQCNFILTLYQCMNKNTISSLGLVYGQDRWKFTDTVEHLMFNCKFLSASQITFWRCKHIGPIILKPIKCDKLQLHINYSTTMSHSTATNFGVQEAVVLSCRGCPVRYFTCRAGTQMPGALMRVTHHPNCPSDRMTTTTTTTNHATASLGVSTSRVHIVIHADISRGVRFSP